MKLKGAQMSFFEERAYTTVCEGVRRVLCAMHIDLYRIAMEPKYVHYTGETFSVEVCEHCKEFSQLIENNRNKVVANS